MSWMESATWRKRLWKIGMLCAIGLLVFVVIYIFVIPVVSIIIENFFPGTFGAACEPPVDGLCRIQTGLVPIVIAINLLVSGLAAVFISKMMEAKEKKGNPTS